MIRVAFGIKAGEAFQQAVTKVAPEATRWAALLVFSGGTLAFLKALPVVGKYLLQRNIVRFAIPVVNVPLSAGSTWFFTGQTGRVARDIFRLRARNAAAAPRVVGLADAVDPDLILRVMWVVVRADGQVTQDEASLLNHVAAGIGAGAEGGGGVAERLRQFVDLPIEVVARQVAALDPEAKDAIWQAALRAAAGDGHVHRKERRVMDRLAEACGREFDPWEVEQLEA